MAYSTDEVQQRAVSVLETHPVTGGPLEILDIKVEFPRGDEMDLSGRINLEEVIHPYGLMTEKMPGRIGLASYRLYEGHDWWLFFKAASTTEDIGGIVVLLAHYRGTEYIFKAMVPWTGTGPFWRVVPPYVLNVLQAGPAVLETATGFLIFARYRLGYQTSVEEFFYFDEEGNFIPFICYSGLRPMGYIPVYVDFDIQGPFDDSAAVYHPKAIQRWNQIVSEFESTEARLGVPIRHDRDHRLMNVLLFNQGAMWSWVEAYVNPNDNPDQYVALWSTYDAMKHPRMSLAGRSVVRKDLVYTYVVRNAQPGLHGPRFIMRQIPESSWREQAGMQDVASLSECPCIRLAGVNKEVPTAGM